MPWNGPNGEAIERIVYSYSLTGLDFGLQHMDAVNFVMNVKGACTLEYGWYNATQSKIDNADVYNIYGMEVYVHPGDISKPMGGSIWANPYQVDSSRANKSYAIIPDTAGRPSNAKSIDPWYKTLDSNGSLDYAYVVESQRPVLSCWESDSWSYGGNTTYLISDLGSLPRLNIPYAIRNELMPARLADPMIYDVAYLLGKSILISSSGTPDGILDASIPSYTADFERLIFASYVATKNVLRNTILASNISGLDNSIYDNTGAIKPGVGDFVIDSSDVVTLSFNVLILVPAICLFFWVVRIVFTFIRPTHKNSRKTSRFTSRLTLRAVGLQPVQPYRLLDEEVCSYRNDWVRRRGVIPYIKKARPVLLVPRTESDPDLNTPEAQKQETTGGVSTVDTEIQRHETTKSGKGAGTAEAVTTAADISAFPQYALFAAPKVIKGPDGVYHLGFTGPIPREKDHNRECYLDGGWLWRKLWWKSKNGARKVVVNKPTREFLATTII